MAATANVNASTRLDLCYAATVQLGMSTTEQRAAKVCAVLSMNGCAKHHIHARVLSSLLCIIVSYLLNAQMSTNVPRKISVVLEHPRALTLWGRSVASAKVVTRSTAKRKNA